MKRDTIKHVPEEVIQEILINLRVKSLLRFKSVTKSWRSWICSNTFKNAHLKRSSHYTNHRLMICSDEDRDGGVERLRSCSLNFLFNNPNYKDYCRITSLEHHPIHESGSLIEIVGSCNGLILLYFEPISSYAPCLILWNPSTRQVRNIPPPRLGTYRGFDYGFGYDDSTDDYKIVGIACRDPREARMYSLKTNSWKKIDNFDEDFLGEGPGKYANGRLHWVAEDDDGDLKNIVSIDMVEGKYDIVVPPQQLLGSCYNKLDVLGGYLSVVSVDCVWVMKKYGEAESWTKIPKFFYFGDPLRQVPIWLEKNGDVAVAVALNRSNVILYNRNFKSRRARVYEVDGDIFERGIYVESLLSPFADQELHQ